MKLLRNWIFISLIACVSSVIGQDCIPKKQNPPRLVNDFANILSPSEENMLERTLVAFNDTTSTQIAIVTVSDLCGYDRAQLHMR